MSIQAFEHRLYLPLAGMLLVFPQFMIFSNKVPARLLASGILPVIVLFAGINILHQRNFVNPLRFWTQAVETSPSSAYAHMLLALQQPDKATALQTMQQAQLLDPKTHHIHFNKGLLYGKFNEMDSAWYYFLAEQRLSGYYECNFQLARIAKKTGRLQLARDYYAQYLSRNPNRGTNDLSSFQQQYPIADTSLSIYFSKVLK
jgi:tetratricopeptide (TPR) repeat protein